MIKAYAAYEPNAELKPFEYDPGPLGDDEVEIEVQYCGICYSDLSMIDNDWGMSQFPIVPGHEVVGPISALGDQVSHLRVGDWVGLGWQSGYCMTCSFCLSGDHNLCSSAQGTIVGHHGGFAERVRACANCVVKLPDASDRESAGPLFCAGITVFNPLIQFGIQPTDAVGVIGIGGLGHMALQFLNAWGCNVTAFTSCEEKKTDALAMGAHHAVDSCDPSEVEAVAGHFDYLISTVSVNLDWNTYIGALHPKGRLHFVGVTLAPMEVSVVPLIMSQRSVSGSAIGSPGNIAKMLAFAIQHDIKPVIEKYSFDDVNEAITKLRSGQARYRIVLCH
jgi:uncharacterized zinc-type alcohol dehydrogenase-like protein